MTHRDNCPAAPFGILFGECNCPNETTVTNMSTVVRGALSSAMNELRTAQPSRIADGPAAPAVGNNGRWVLLGEVSVDSASIGITDLLVDVNGSALTNVGAKGSHYAVPGSEFAGDWGTGIRFWAGFGDGGYQVWGWIVDYGDSAHGEVDERVAQVVMTMIDAQDLADWRTTE